MGLHRLTCLATGLQLVALLGKAVEPLGQGALLEEVRHQGLAL